MKRVLSAGLARLIGRKQRAAPKLTTEQKRATKQRAREEAVTVFSEDFSAVAAIAETIAAVPGSHVISVAAGTSREQAMPGISTPHIVWLRRGERLRAESLRAALGALRRDASSGAAFGAADEPPVLRRDALLQAGGFADTDGATFAEMTRLGWKIIGADGHAWPLPPIAGEDTLRAAATLFLSLSGRAWAWPQTAKFLERQTFLHDRTHLFILDTSQDAAFGAKVRAWLARCHYAGTTCVAERVGPSGVADLPRPEALDAVRHAVGTIYNRFARACTTPLALFLEDDVLPPDDAYVRLARRLGPHTLSVSGLYLGRHERYRRGAPIAWNWLPNGQRENLSGGAGVARVGGNGFGCVVMRGELLCETVFRSGPPFNDFDFNFYHDAVCRDAREVLLDWDCVCRHYDGPDAWI
jgi:hypothetical protein